jgi:hypothetical protein
VPITALPVVAVVVAKVMAVVVAKEVVMITPKMVAMSPPLSVIAYRFHHFVQLAVTAFEHDEIAADFTVTVGKQVRGKSNRLRQAIADVMDVPVNSLTGQSTAHQQSIDYVFLSPGCAGPNSQHDQQSDY